VKGLSFVVDAAASVNASYGFGIFFDNTNGGTVSNLSLRIDGGSSLRVNDTEHLVRVFRGEFAGGISVLVQNDSSVRSSSLLQIKNTTALGDVDVLVLRSGVNVSGGLVMLASAASTQTEAFNCCDVLGFSNSAGLFVI
jgi:hypothetical protein